MNRFSILALAASVLLLTQACKKDPVTPEPSAPTTEQLLMANTWHLTAMTVDPAITVPGAPPVTDLYAFMPACSKDDTQRFLTGGVARLDEGATKCDPNDPQTQNATWALAKAGTDTNLTITDGSGNPVVYKLLSVTDSQLKMSTQDDFFTPGKLSTITVTFGK